jgi:predicted  nucleic acid-binding Zn-ribbon protein
MKQQATVEKLANELTEARATYQQLKRQVYDLGCRTSRMYKTLDELRAEAGKAPTNGGIRER